MQCNGEEKKRKVCQNGEGRGHSNGRMKNDQPCQKNGKGFGQGEGRGKGRNRNLGRNS